MYTDIPYSRPIWLYKVVYFIPLLKLMRHYLLFVLLTRMFIPWELVVSSVLLLLYTRAQHLVNRRCSINVHRREEVRKEREPGKQWRPATMGLVIFTVISWYFFYSIPDLLCIICIVFIDFYCPSWFFFFALEVQVYEYWVPLLANYWYNWVP